MEKTEASFIDRIKRWARTIKRDVLTLWIAALALIAWFTDII